VPKYPSGKDAQFAKGSIIVKPPITPGEDFKIAIYGQDGHGVSIHHVVTTSEVTLFTAGSTLETPARRHTAIYKIADRIKQLADKPERFLELSKENPFPQPR
jgi:hypothetical protein